MDTEDREPIFEEEELTLEEEVVAKEKPVRKEEPVRKEPSKDVGNGKVANTAADVKDAKPQVQLKTPDAPPAHKEEHVSHDILQSKDVSTSRDSIQIRADHKPKDAVKPSPMSSSAPDGGKGDESLFGNVDPMVGKVIADRWEIIELLGEGSMSLVYKAKEVETGKIVVLKALHSHLLAKLPNVKRFEQKAKANANLRHPNISNFHDFYLSTDGQVYLITDYINGQSLEDLLSKSGHLAVERAISLFTQAIEALEYAHQEKILHRDLKPSNIVVQKEAGGKELARVVDFGIAKLLTDESDDVKSNQYITHTREVFGSPLYMSPEQCMGRKLDPRSDIYSLGCVMYETISGKPPFVGKNVLETAYKHMNEAPRPLVTDSSEDPVLSRFELVVLKMLAKDADNRYQNVTDIKHDLGLIHSASDDEWQDQAIALKKATKSKRLESKRLPVSFEMMVILTTSVLLIVVVAVWSLSFLSPDSQDFPSFNDDQLWVINDKKRSANAVQDFGNREEAARMNLATVERERGPDCREYSDALFNLVELYSKAEHWADAALNLTRLIETTKKNGGPMSLGNCYKQLGYCYFMQDEYDEAISNSNVALDLLEKEFGPVSPNMMLSMQVLGDIYTRKKDLENAQRIYERMLAITDSLKDRSPLDFAKSSAKLADVYRREGKLELAENHYRQGLEWVQNTIGKENAFVPKTMYGLGLTLMAEKKYKEAEQMFKDALPLAKASLGERTALVGAIRRHYSEVLWKTNWVAAVMMKIGSADATK